ncbi:NAD(P)-dependent dehydrogenase (short-subunit alcohol dehydrogenase family) [Crossiella equi]|uniref:NAD(P)-dependent dehydrogenase (Short-subunit alcohol dehydrogenase family) n=1 Tax=Crossiella equi TaxID=130796 RepID=A0ABS5AS99_9PSEU|nr:SDR family NAD(P)-dependent oxidoreductase [Crossiella equi]MBP2479467.1 NAD(P)-dependent dehydrogenase (short-subunit alcohol dehydrogenase family) [Crossiella equi]
MRIQRGSVAFVTGGAQGIGLGIARALAARGVLLALADVDSSALARGAEELSRHTEVATFRLDVRDREGFTEAADEAESRLGPVSLLFNNAGILAYSPAAELSYAKWDHALGVNLTGVVNGVQTFLPRLLARGQGGHIVNTSSGAGLAAGSGVLYTTAKFAVVGLSESLHQELAGHGIDVSVLCPGPVDTGIARNTRAVPGGESVALPAEHLPGVDAFLQGGLGINEVGELVLAGMAAGALWIHTDGTMREPLRQRTEALFASLPG